MNVMHVQLLKFMSAEDINKVTVKYRISSENTFYVCVCTYMDF